VPVSIQFSFPASVIRNLNVRKQLYNAALFARDLWVSMSPRGSGQYIDGLMQGKSIVISGGTITITNFSRTAQFFEEGHRAFNIGMKMLQNGKNVKHAKDGSRYKIIKMPIGMRKQATYSKPSVAASITRNFKGLVPAGMKIKSYGDTPSYRARKFRPISGGKKRNNEIMVVSERAIRMNPSKWYVPAMAGRKIGQKVKEIANPVIQQAILNASIAEMQRQFRNSSKG